MKLRELSSDFHICTMTLVCTYVCLHACTHKRSFFKRPLGISHLMLTGKDGSILEYRTMQDALERGPGSGPPIQHCYSLYHLFIVIIHSASLVGTKQFRHHITCTSRVLRSEGDKDTDKSQSLVSQKSRKKMGRGGTGNLRNPS